MNLAGNMIKKLRSNFLSQVYLKVLMLNLDSSIFYSNYSSIGFGHQSFLWNNQPGHI